MPAEDLGYWEQCLPLFSRQKCPAGDRPSRELKKGMFTKARAAVHPAVEL